MAALLDLPPTQATVVREARPLENERLTQYGTPEFPQREEPAFLSNAGIRRGRTASAVGQEERGDPYESETNVGKSRNGVTRVETPKTEASNGHTIRIRSEVARDIRNRIDTLIPIVGQIAFATELQLLKRDLSRCHDLLRNRPSETNFVSIMTLVESAMSQRKWREYGPSPLELIRSAIDVGYRKTSVRFSDYESIRQQFSEESIDSHPRIDLASLDLSDFTDDKEEEE